MKNRISIKIKVFLFFGGLYLLFSIGLYLSSFRVYKNTLLERNQKDLRQFGKIFLNATRENFKNFDYSNIEIIAKRVFSKPIDLLIIHFPDSLFDINLFSSEVNMRDIKNKNYLNKSFLIYRHRIEKDGKLLGILTLGILKKNIFSSLSTFKKLFLLIDISFAFVFGMLVFLIFKSKNKEITRLINRLKKEKGEKFLDLNWSEDILQIVLKINELLKDIFEKREKLRKLENLRKDRLNKEKERLERELEEFRNLKKVILKAEDDLAFSDNLLVYGKVFEDLQRELREPLEELREEIETELIDQKVDKKTKQRVLKIYASIEDILKLLDELKALVSSSITTKGHFNLSELLLRKVKEFKEKNRDIKFKVDIKKDVKFFGNLHQISIAISNILENAVEELKENEYVQNKEISVKLKEENDSLFIIIEDNGGGFENINEALNAFYTTKYTEEHRGLGLTLTQKIIIEHGGGIILENKVEGGAKVIIEFPLSK